MSLLVDSLHMRIDSVTIIRVQELASGFIRRRLSFIFPCGVFVYPCFRVSYKLTPTKLSQYCVFVCNLTTFRGYIMYLI